MDPSILKSDVFFVVTTIAVIIISIGLAFALFYIVRILKDLNALSQKAKVEGEKILDDVKAFREASENNTTWLVGKAYSIFSFLFSKSKTNKKKNN